MSIFVDSGYLICIEDFIYNKYSIKIKKGEIVGYFNSNVYGEELNVYNIYENENYEFDDKVDKNLIFRIIDEKLSIKHFNNSFEINIREQVEMTNNFFNSFESYIVPDIKERRKLKLKKIENKTDFFIQKR